MAYAPEGMEEVIAYARNDHLGFAIPYLWQSQQREYSPEHRVRLRQAAAPTGELKVILEVKGRETEEERQKYVAARPRSSSCVTQSA